LKKLVQPKPSQKIGQISKAVFGAAFKIKKTEDFSAYIALRDPSRTLETAVGLNFVID
jgi:hypothetical protein